MNLTGIIFLQCLQSLRAERLGSLQAAYNEDSNIRISHERQSVGHLTDRRSIDYNEIVLLAHLVDELVQLVAMDQLSRVRRNRTCTDKVEIKILVVQNKFALITLVNQVVGHTNAIFDSKFGVDVRLTYVKIHQQCFLTGHAIQCRKVS